jgi:hypothetical protein
MPDEPKKNQVEETEEIAAGMRKKEREEGEKLQGEKSSAREYFDSMGINPRIERNDFTVKEALEVFTKAKDALKRQESNKDLVTGILDKAYQIFRLLT